jgi:hypothetical protein
MKNIQTILDEQEFDGLKEANKITHLDVNDDDDDDGDYCIYVH